jgi:hypothetical protein
MHAPDPAAPASPSAAPARLSRSAQARVNGARSRGPVSAAGKARSARNALRHGCRARPGLLLADEDGAALAGLQERLVAELAPVDEVDGWLVARIAAAMWKAARAERMEVELVAAAAAAPGLAHPLARVDVARFLAALRYQRQATREVHACLAGLARRGGARPQVPAAGGGEDLVPGPPPLSEDPAPEPAPRGEDIAPQAGPAAEDPAPAAALALGGAAIAAAPDRAPLERLATTAITIFRAHGQDPGRTSCDPGWMLPADAEAIYREVMLELAQATLALAAAARAPVVAFYDRLPGGLKATLRGWWLCHRPRQPADPAADPAARRRHATLEALLQACPLDPPGRPPPRASAAPHGRHDDPGPPADAPQLQALLTGQGLSARTARRAAAMLPRPARAALLRQAGIPWPAEPGPDAAAAATGSGAESASPPPPAAAAATAGRTRAATLEPPRSGSARSQNILPSQQLAPAAPAAAATAGGAADPAERTQADPPGLKPILRRLRKLANHDPAAAEALYRSCSAAVRKRIAELW